MAVRRGGPAVGASWLWIPGGKQLTFAEGHWKRHCTRYRFCSDTCKTQSTIWKTKKGTGQSLGQMSNSPAKADTVMVVWDTRLVFHMPNSPSI